MNKILMICPTRGRGHKIQEFYDLFKKNSIMSDLVFSIDSDDEHNYERIEDPNVFYEVGFRNDIVPAINYVAYKYAQNPQYEFIGMLNDNHWVETYAWDKILYEKVAGNRKAICYPNDLYNPGSLVDIRTGNLVDTKDLYASAIIMSSDIIKALGYMANPLFKHAYPDVVWVDLGKKLDSLFYFDDIIFRHTLDTDSPEQYLSRKKEEELYLFYWNNAIDKDVDLINKYLEVYYE